ncbi:MAG TPA: CoA pyrophosphatase [Ignavibacteriaceae bacterium]|nr:CoA pyrophosphatase [Ignavibacteriaceae bacterium]
MQKKFKIDLKEIKNLLPDSPGILRKDEYFNSAVLIPLLLINGEYNILFEKRSAGIRQGGEICFPGGETDKLQDSGMLETAVRETCEELGIRKNQISVIGGMDTLVGSMGVTVDSYIAELNIRSLNELKIDQNEVEKVFSLPVSFFLENPPESYELHIEVHPFYTDDKGERIELFPARQLNLPERYHNSWQVRKNKVWVYKTAEGAIWGITAALIKEVMRIIAETI